MVTVAAVKDSSAQAPPPSGEERAAFQLMDEAVEKIAKYSLKLENRATIYNVALFKLVEARLGERFAKVIPAEWAQSTEDARSGYQNAIRQLAQSPGQRLSTMELVEASLQEYCKEIDIFSRYFTARQWSQRKSLERQSGSGIGASLMEREDRYMLYPFPGSASAKAGIDSGDELLMVESQDVTDLTLMQIADMVRGAPGTEIELTIAKRAFGRRQKVTVEREALEQPIVAIRQQGPAVSIQIRRFDKDVVKQLEEALERFGPGRPLTIDLRSNQGGELDAVVDALSLFLPEGEIIGYLRELEGVQTIKARGPVKYEPASILMLQNEGTASGSELFIAALVENPKVRATSRGPGDEGDSTYGKGVVQAYFDMSNGGHLRITSGLIFGPNKKTWNMKGLRPSLTAQNGEIYFPDANELNNKNYQLHAFEPGN